MRGFLNQPVTLPRWLWAGLLLTIPIGYAAGGDWAGAVLYVGLMAVLCLVQVARHQWAKRKETAADG